MAKDPAVLFYTQDFLTGTSLMTAEEVGCYIRLLCYQQQYESLSEMAIRKILNGSYERIWPAIAEKFEQDPNGNFYNERMREEISRRQKHSSKQKNNANKRWHKSGICDGNATAMPLETATEIETKDLRKEESVKEENHSRGELTYDAEQTVLANPIRFEQLCMSTQIPDPNARDALRNYHLFNAEKDRYPMTRGQVFAGFEKWLRNEKKFTNGTHKQASATQIRSERSKNFFRKGQQAFNDLASGRADDG